MNAKRLLITIFLLCLCLVACQPSTTRKPPVETVVVEVAVPVATEAPVSFEIPGTALAAATPAPGYEGISEYPSNPQISFPQPYQAGQMIIKDAQMELLVADTDRAIERVTTLVADQGGYIISARSWLENDFKRAEIRMGVPSTNFENTLTYLRNLGIKVLNENVSGQDVSAEYTDLKSRLGNLEATATRVREFLDKASTVEDSLRVNQALSDLEGQIEQIKGQMKFYEGRAAYSTITLSITPEMPTPTPTPTPTPGPGWNPGSTVKIASEAMVSLLQGTVDALIWIAFLAWPFVLIAVIVWLVLKRNKGKKPKKGNQS